MTMVRKAMPPRQRTHDDEGRPLWVCGGCAGRGRVWCPDCVVGTLEDNGRVVKCARCNGHADLRCPVCRGGEEPVPPPQW